MQVRLNFLLAYNQKYPQDSPACWGYFSIQYQDLEVNLQNAFPQICARI